jgi:hypothetical protein
VHYAQQHGLPKKPKNTLIIEKKEKTDYFNKNMTIQILHYEFLGPIQLDEWGPPMDKVVFVILSRNKDLFSIIYADQSEKTNEADFFTKHKKFKCWINHAGSAKNLYLSIYPMSDSDEKERQKLVNKTLDRYKPVCNIED